MLRKVEVREIGARRSRQVERVEWRMFMVLGLIIRGCKLGSGGCEK